MPKSNGLTEKQKAFCEEYIIDFNGTQAAIRAGYSKKTASVTAAENLVKPNIQAYIQQLTAKRSKRTEITADNVLKEIARLAFSDIRETFSEQGNLINPKNMGDDMAAAVQSVDIVTTYEKDENGDSVPIQTRKIKLADKTRNLELLAKHLGLLMDRVKVSGDNDNPLINLLGSIDGKDTSLPNGDK